MPELLPTGGGASNNRDDDDDSVEVSDVGRQCWLSESASFRLLLSHTLCVLDEFLCSLKILIKARRSQFVGLNTRSLISLDILLTIFEYCRLASLFHRALITLKK